MTELLASLPAERVIRLASFVFLGGIVMIGLAAVPPVARRYRRILLDGFLLALLALVLVGLAGWLLD